MLKRIAPVVVAFCLLFGFAYFTHSSPTQQQTGRTTANPTDQTDRRVAFVGVVERADSTKKVLEIITSAGGSERVNYLDVSTDMAFSAGQLVRISGGQDAASRVVDAEALERVNGSDFYRVAPADTSTVTSPLIVSGFVKTSVDQLFWRIANTDGEQATGVVPLKQTNEEGYEPIRFEVFLPAFTTMDFSLTVDSDKMFDAESTPLSLLSDKTMTFQIYFADYAGSDCRAIEAKKRTVAQTAAQGKAAILELLAGPTGEEFNQGVRSALPEGVVLNTLVINNGEANVRLSGFEPSRYTRCQKTRMIRQIKQTLLQFEPIGSVNIYINDESLG